MPRELQVGLLRRPDVPANERDETLAVATFQQLDHLEMFLADGFEQRGIADAVRTDRMRLHGEVLDHLDQRRVAASGEKCPVKEQILAEDAPEVARRDGRTMTPVDHAELRDEGRRRR